MSKIKDRKSAIIDSIRALKAKTNDADALVLELEKVKDKLPKEAKDALDKHQKTKAGKKE